MAPSASVPIVKSEVVSDPTVMSGEPVIRGTRILAETIVSYLKAGARAEEIFRDYPSLPIDALEAVQRWANDVHGPEWATMTMLAPAH